jgi:hypothetical protein
MKELMVLISKLENNKAQKLPESVIDVEIIGNVL